MSSFSRYKVGYAFLSALGSSGLRVPVFSIGGWPTIGDTIKGDPVKDILKTAFENGINVCSLPLVSNLTGFI
jgi:hypothetical protein